MELHDLVMDFVLPCINRPVSKDSLSPHNISLIEDGRMHWTPSDQKLIADPPPKQYIVVHLIPLRWMVANGFRVTQILKAYKFDQKPFIDQKPFMKTFIYTIVSKRSAVKAKVKKDIFKHNLNSAFIKMCNDAHNKSRCGVVSDPKECVNRCLSEL